MYMAETLNTRVTRLENLMGVLAEAQIRTEECFQETDRRFRDTDARIDKLVGAIGELIRRERP